MQKPIAQVFTKKSGDGIDISFDSLESELIFWNFISQLDKSDVEERILQLTPPERE